MSDTKTESDFLAEIYGAPDDDSARAVFADWLTERRDPRGEFITLQLARHAGRGTPASAKRETSLLKAHGKTWAGPLDRILDKNFRVFSRGFLAEGVLQFVPDGKNLPKELSDPSFAAMNGVMASAVLREETSIVGLTLLKHPAIRRLRALRNFQLPLYLAVVKADGPRTTLEELHIGEAHDDYAFRTEEPEPLPIWGALSDGVAFPNLKRLAIDGTTRELAMVIDGALGKKLESIMLCSTTAQGLFAKLLPKLATLPALKEACITTTIISHIPRSYWSYVFRRDANGDFTHLHCETFFAHTKLPSPHELDSALGQLPPDSITELTIQKTPKNPFDEEDTAMLNKRVATFTKITKLEVPWQRDS